MKDDDQQKVSSPLRTKVLGQTKRESIFPSGGVTHTVIRMGSDNKEHSTVMHFSGVGVMREKIRKLREYQSK